MRSVITREEVIESALHWGLDMREWEEVRIQQIVDIVNTPIEFPALPLGMKVELDPSMPVGALRFHYPRYPGV
jgi:hypothetical protein